MFVVLYRWRIKPNYEKQFVESWSKITEHFVENFGALGSRLHHGDDGIWYAYAQWLSAQQREQAFENIPEFPARAKMRETIEESFSEVKLEIAADFLQFPEI